jgi:hypothetical protein
MVRSRGWNVLQTGSVCVRASPSLDKQPGKYTWLDGDQVGQYLLHLFIGGCVERVFTVNFMNGTSGPTPAGFSLFRFIAQQVIFLRGIKFLGRLAMGFMSDKDMKIQGEWI